MTFGNSENFEIIEVTDWDGNCLERTLVEDEDLYVSEVIYESVIFHLSAIELKPFKVGIIISVVITTSNIIIS